MKLEKLKIFKMLSIIAPVVWISLVMIVLFTIISPRFFSVTNIRNMLRYGSPLLIAGIGQTMIMLTEGIDLSVSYVIGLCAIFTAYFAAVSIPLAILIGIGVGIFFGLVNGTLVAKGNLPPFISTLGMGQICLGLGLLLTGGLTVPALITAFRAIGGGTIGPFPIPLIIAVIVFFSMLGLINKTPYGRNMYGLGGNPQSLRLAGVNIELSTVTVYAVSGMLYGIAGVILACRNASGSINVAEGWEFQTLAAVLIGGSSFQEGRGHIGKTVLGVILVTILRNGLNVAGVPNAFQYLLIGVIVLTAIILDVTIRSKVRKPL